RQHRRVEVLLRVQSPDVFVIDQKDPVQDTMLAHQVFGRRDLLCFLLRLLLTEKNGWYRKTCADCAGPEDEFATAAGVRIGHANLPASDTFPHAEGCLLHFAAG